MTDAPATPREVLIAAQALIATRECRGHCAQTAIHYVAPYQLYIGCLRLFADAVGIRPLGHIAQIHDWWDAATPAERDAAFDLAIAGAGEAV